MTPDALKLVRRAALETLRPPPKTPLAEWTEAHIRLPASLSAQPGPMRLWPHQVEIANAMGNPEIERVSVLKSARVGFSQLLAGVIGNYVSNDPSPILTVLPAEADCRTLWVSSLEPTFKESPLLRTAFSDDRKRDTLLEKHFPGGSLRLVSARTPRNLRAVTARVLVMDEIDAFEVNLAGEGDPIALAEKRTFTFSNRKIIAGSTPVFEATSPICRMYERSDQRVYEVPCPHCHEPFEIKWKHIQWENGKPETAYCACPNCGGVIEESDKPALVEAGGWRATRPEVKGHAGFRLNSLISLLPNARWSILATEFIQAKKSPETLQAFVNTVLGEPWRDEVGEGFSEADLAARSEPISLDQIPPEVWALTCGVDVQRDRLECITLGHTREDETLILAQHVFWGAPESPEPWAELRDHLMGVWTTPDKRVLRMGATAIDAGDGSTMDRVLAFARDNRALRVFAIKGAAGQRQVIAPASRGRLFIIGVDGVKRQLHNRLSREGLVRFSDTLQPRFYDELTSERLVTTYSRGQPVQRWERIAGRRAEALDCVVYALAVKSLLAAPPEAPGDARPKPAKPSVVKSKWMSR